MGKVFTVDVAKCNGCFNCQIACKDEHAGNDWSPYAKAQPEIGQFWVKVNEHVGGTIPKVRIHYIARLCNHCDNAKCMDVCPVGAIYRREDALVLIDPEKCVGCGKCRDACPYDVIYKSETLGICQKCTGCAHLLDNGYAQPRCVEACPTDALGFGEESELRDFIDGADVDRPETGLHPRVYYRNIPGRFIAGTVYDPVSKEVITGAKIRATIGGKTYSALSDEYGDFWLTDLAKGKYNVVIEAAGYEYLALDNVDATIDVNLGDLAMTHR
jgi:Fe-S-cluster-containing dehydrogenase component